MENIWEILGIEPSQDTAVIKKAYAQQTRKYHPEENPELFLRLRKAYEAALAYCDSSQQQVFGKQLEGDSIQENFPKGFPETERAPEKQLMESDSIHEGESGADTRKKQADLSVNTGWQIIAEEQETEDNPYIDHDAHKQFLTLYTGKQRNNSKLWLAYFTSPAFLQVHREPAFAALLLEDVEQQQPDNPPEIGRAHV